MTRQQDAMVRDLSRNPALGVRRETVKYLIKSVVGVQPYRCNSRKQQRMELLASEPEVVADLADYDQVEAACESGQYSCGAVLMPHGHFGQRGLLQCSPDMRSASGIHCKG
jgi:hypothetical protein